MTLELRRLPRSRDDVVMLDYEPRRAREVTLVVGHGYSSSKHNLDFLCAFLSSQGFRVLSLDFPGHKLGASGGTLASLDDLTDAMATVVSFARARYDGPIYTLGHSMGAVTALLTCADDPQIAGAVSIATGYARSSAISALAKGGTVDLRSGYVDGLTLPEISTQIERILDATLAALVGRPVLYVVATRDGMVSRTSARELYERAPEPKTYREIDSDHTSAGENSRATVLQWLNERHPRTI